jgi:cytochrome c peroxidase
MKINKLKIFSILIVIWVASCSEDQSKSGFGLTYPAYFPVPHYQSDKNPISKDGFELGRALFFDPILSIDSTISCETCHAQGHAFADHNTRFSVGIEGKRSNRNSPPIFNLAWQTSFMWDGGINHIEVMPLAPITNEVEMGESLNNVIKKLNNNSRYKQKFQKVFGEKPVDSQKLFYALAQYMTMLVSSDAKYDRYRQGKTSLSSEEIQGLTIFRQKCASCHPEPLFTDYSFRNTGLEILNDDTGHGRISLLKEDEYKFKVPSLRNVSLTYPYMHDGRFRTLSDVLSQYSDHTILSEKIDPLLKNSGKAGIALSVDEKKSIIAFLNTLTDYSFISNPLYSE